MGNEQFSAAVMSRREYPASSAMEYPTVAETSPRAAVTEPGLGGMMLRNSLMLPTPVMRAVACIWPLRLAKSEAPAGVASAAIERRESAGILGRGAYMVDS